MRLVWEIDKCPVSYNTKEASQCSLNDEDPSPSVEALASFKLHQPVGKDTSASRGQTSKHVEDGIALSNVVPSIYLMSNLWIRRIQDRSGTYTMWTRDTRSLGKIQLLIYPE